jgi:glucosamine--fructose-6-phosphate aminotransferase (isomerizing)
MYKRAKENKKKRRQNNMCGIIGVLGDHEAAPIMVEALKRLEYRGYDSAGIATVDSARRLGRRRAVGKLVNLSDRLVHEPLAGKSGIGHTRWATHGGPTEVNAHPHKMGRVAAVHNGIIENFQELREDLESRGVTFQTETDSETTVALAEFFLAQGLSPRDAVEQTIARLEGAYALCFLFDGEDDLMIVARKGSPLVIGYGEGEVFVGSDAIALGPLTDRVTYLEEGDWAVLTRDSVEIINARGDRANRPVTTIQIDTAQIDKGGYKHFMAKEIAEQPSVIKHAISAYAAGADLALPSGLDFSQIDRISIVACGTAHLAGAVARYWFEKIARLPVEVDVASEFRYREPPIPPRTLAIFLSQSGETADTLAALRYMRDKAQVLSITNVATSSIAREADLNLQIHAGAEIGVASTKAFTCKLIVLAALALKAAQDRGEMEAADVAAHLAALDRLPGLMNQALERANEIDSAARKLAEAQDVLFLGRGAMYPLALEGALKLKEISYIHAEGYASGELKHGPIALIDKSVPVVVLAPRDALFEKTISNMQEVMARDGKVLLITDAEGARIAGSGTWRTLVMPDVPELFAPILYAVPAQLLAYYTAVAKGTDVDQPRNLAKSVTVE